MWWYCNRNISTSLLTPSHWKSPPMENSRDQTDKLYSETAHRPKHHIIIWSRYHLFSQAGKHYPCLRRPIYSQQHTTSHMVVYSTRDNPSKPNQDLKIILLIYWKQTKRREMGTTRYSETLENSASPMDSRNFNKTRWRGPRQHHQIHPPRRITKIIT